MTSRLASVRARATLGASVIVAIALVVAGVALVTLLKSSQIDAVDTTLDLRVSDIESLLANGTAVGDISIEDESDGFVQILDSSGNVLASSGNIDGEAALVDPDSPRYSTRTVTAVEETEPFRIHVHQTEGAVSDTIIVGTNLEDIDETLAVLTGALTVGLPLLLMLMAGMIWLVIGRALRPVEEIRLEVADIGGGDLHRRVPVPKSQDEIGRLASTMNGMLDRLESADLAQARFVSNASHELRTPIAIIRHELEVALRTDDDAMLRSAAEESLEEDLRMQRLVDDLLFLARRDAALGATKETPRTLVDLDDIALTEAHRVRTDKTIDISLVSAGQVRGSEGQLSRVLRNLIDNALRHATSTVAVSVVSAGGKVVVCIDDDGNGVDEVDRERIFERFERADEARARDDGGSGLGLAIVTEMVADHHGTVTVDKSPDLGGARFTVTLTDARL